MVPTKIYNFKNCFEIEFLILSMRALAVMCILLRDNRNFETWEQIKGPYTHAANVYVFVRVLRYVDGEVTYGHIQ